MTLTSMPLPTKVIKICCCCETESKSIANILLLLPLLLPLLFAFVVIIARCYCFCSRIFMPLALLCWHFKHFYSNNVAHTHAGWQLFQHSLNNYQENATTLPKTLSNDSALRGRGATDHAALALFAALSCSSSAALSCSSSAALFPLLCFVFGNTFLV